METSDVYTISDDGLTIVGEGRNPAGTGGPPDLGYHLERRIDPGSAGYAAPDGNVDLDDLGLFPNLWLTGI